MKKCFRIGFFLSVFLSVVSVFAQSETDKGIALYGSGDFDQSAVILEKCVENDPKDVKAWTYLGAVYVRKGLKKEAGKAFAKADSIKLSKMSKDETLKYNDGFEIISKPRPGYTDGARENRVQGEVKIAVEFGESGKITLLYPVKTLPFGLTENTVDAVRKIKFTPAQKDGKVVPIVKIVSYSFTIY